MADQKISQLTALLGANTASGDLVTVVDISDTTMGASGTNKKMTLAEFQASPVSAGTANGVLYLNGTKVPTSGSALTFDGTYFTANGLRLAGTDLTNTIYQATGALGISTGSASGITFATNSTTRMSLDSSGNLGIGTASPGAKLDVAGSARATGEFRSNHNTANYVSFVSAGSGGNLQAGTNGADGAVFSSSGKLKLQYNASGVATGFDTIVGGNFIVGQGGDLLQHVSVLYGDAGANKAPVLSLFRSGSREVFAAVLNSGQLGFGNTGGLGGVYTDSALNAATQMVLDSSGNLGIGTASPGVKLDVRAASNPSVYVGLTSSTPDYRGYRIDFSSAQQTSGITTTSSSPTTFLDLYSGGSATNLGGWSGAIRFFTGGTDQYGSERMRLDASGNLGLNTSTFGTSAAGVLSLGTGTAPTTGPADTVQLFSVDRSAGNTIPAVRCEGSGVTNAGITNTTVTNKIAISVNGTIYYLLATTNAT